VIYALAAIGAVTVVMLLMRAFDARRRTLDDEEHGQPVEDGQAVMDGEAVVPPDDDPEFLRWVVEQQRRQDHDGEHGDG
jgi:hypothetical protein